MRSSDFKQIVEPKCGCGMKDGGSVKPTIQEIEAMAGADKPSFAKPLVLKRREDRQDREGAKEVPLALARGAVAGTLGFGGDIEEQLRALIRGMPAPHDPGDVYNPIDTQRALKDRVDETAALPTSDFYRDVLPVKPESITGKRAEGLATAVGGVPVTSVALKGVRAAAPVVKAGAAAAGKAAERGYNTVEPVIDKLVQDTMNRGGVPADLLGSFATTPSRAVKPSGGNWINLADDSGLTPERTTQMIMDSPGLAGIRPDVAAWANRVIPKYLKNDIGTATDPLTAQFLAGKGHIPTGELQSAIWPYFSDHVKMGSGDAGGVKGMGMDIRGRSMQNLDKGDPWIDSRREQHLAYHADERSRNLVDAAGDKSTRADVDSQVNTPWERLTDAVVSPAMADFLSPELKAANPWMAKAIEKDPDLMVNSIKNNVQFAGWPDWMDLQLDRIPRYMSEAANRGETLAAAKKDPKAFQGPLTLYEQRARDYGVDIDPEDLRHMSIGAAAEIAGRGVKANDLAVNQKVSRMGNTTFKSYGDHPAGYNWQELNPNLSMGPEGVLQNMCIGSECYGHPQNVREGAERAFSLRDRQGNIHATASVTGESPLEQFVKLADDDQEDLVRQVFGDSYKDNIYTMNPNDQNKFIAALTQRQKEDPTFMPTQWRVSEVKGKHNSRPEEEVIPYTRDFMESWPHSKEVGDLYNAGFGVNAHGRYWTYDDFDDAAKKYGQVYNPDTMKMENFTQYWNSNKGLSNKSFDDVKEDFISRMQMEFPGESKLDLPADYQPSYQRPIVNKDPEAYKDGGAVTLPDVDGMWRSYAVGGSIASPDTVGLGTFGQGNQNTVATGGGGFGNPFGAGAGLTNGTQVQQPQQPQNYNSYGLAYGLNDGSNHAGWGDMYGGLQLNGALPDVNPNSKAPIYDINPEAGGLMNPMLQATLQSAGQGSMSLPGVQAFLGNNYQPYSKSQNSIYNPDGTINPNNTGITTQDNTAPLINLARSIGVDPSQYSHDEAGMTKLYSDLNDKTKDYVGIGGLSAGWNPTGDWRGKDVTLYKNVGGKLYPVSDSSHSSAPKTGGWIRQNPLAFQALMAAGSILTGGLAAGAAAGAGAGAGAAAEGAATTGATGATTAGAGATATGAGASTGWGGALANMAGYGSEWAALPAWGQGAIQGAAQGALTSGLSGGNPWQGALMGGVGGVGGYFGGAAGNYLDPALKGFGSQAGSMGAKYFANQARK